MQLGRFPFLPNGECKGSNMENIDNKNNMSYSDQDVIDEKGLQMNTKVKPLSNLERTAMILFCLYSEIGKSGKSAGELAKFANRYGKGSATNYQVNNDLRDLHERKLVFKIEEDKGTQKRYTYALTIFGMIELMLMAYHLPEPIANKCVGDFWEISAAADRLFKEKATFGK